MGAQGIRALWALKFRIRIYLLNFIGVLAYNLLLPLVVPVTSVHVNIWITIVKLRNYEIMLPSLNKNMISATTIN